MLKLFDLTSKTKFVVGFSGGLDSTVLLHLLVELSKTHAIDVRVIHINHQLQANSPAWQQHCAKICNAWNVPFQTFAVTVDCSNGQSVEAAAREARYQLFARELRQEECLLTAHNADDQAETVLLQLLRGAGPKGLAAMPAVKSFANGEHVRPLLTTSRAEIQAYADKMQLTWIEDDSNHDDRFDRNYLRRKVLPSLTQRWPSALHTLARSASHCADAMTLIENYAATEFAKVSVQDGCCLKISELQKLNTLQQQSVLRYWFAYLKKPVPDTDKLRRIFSEVIEASQDANPCLCWANVVVRRYRDTLYCETFTGNNETLPPTEWDLSSSFALPFNLGFMQVKRVKGEGVATRMLNGPFTLRVQQGGERMCLMGREGTHRLKKLWQEWGVPPWQRDRWPLLFKDEELVAVPGFAIAVSHAAKNDEEGVTICYNCTVPPLTR